MQDEACRVIADHVRCLTFALTDGGVPDREGRGYVLRRILRRAVRFGWQYLGLHKPFLCELVDTVVDTMGDAFPELKKSPQHVKEVIREEEESFERTLDRGIAMFEEAAETARRHHHNEIRGDDAFRLHDTYGFPIDLTQVMAQEKGLTVDIAEYERLMEEARERARRTRTLVGATYSPAQTSSATVVVRPAATDDSAKYSDQEIKAKLRAIARPDEQGRFDVVSRPDVARVAEQVGLIFDRTCFYAEAGGQVGDVGSVTAANARFDVEQTRTCGEHVIHWGVVVIGEFRTGETYELAVDRRRAATMKNHTATHVMNWALREVLGDHVQQKGSLVDHEKTRFDFSHPRPLTPGEIERVEQLVKERIRANLPVYYKVVPQQDALKINGLRAVFGERYPDEVRVMSIGVPVEDLIRNPDNAEWRKYSIEFCGGTHLSNTADIERFVVASEEAVAKGIRRIVGLSGSAADLAVELGDALLKRAERLRAGPAEQVAGGLSELQNTLATAVIPVRHRLRLRGLIDELQSIVRQQQKSDAADATRAVKAHVAVLLEQAQKIGDTTVVIGELPDLSVDQLKTGADMIKQKCGSAAVLLGVRVLPQEDNQSRDRQGGSAGVSPANTRPGPASKALLLAAMTPDLVKKGLKAGDLVKAIAPIIGGAGGGPPTMAQAGGRALDKLADALAAGRKWLTDRL
jgi:alanyl-tRNA synthetase